MSLQIASRMQCSAHAWIKAEGGIKRDAEFEVEVGLSLSCDLLQDPAWMGCVYAGKMQLAFLECVPLHE